MSAAENAKRFWDSPRLRFLIIVTLMGCGTQGPLAAQEAGRGEATTIKGTVMAEVFDAQAGIGEVLIETDAGPYLIVDEQTTKQLLDQAFKSITAVGQIDRDANGDRIITIQSYRINE